MTISVTFGNEMENTLLIKEARFYNVTLKGIVAKSLCLQIMIKANLIR